MQDTSSSDASPENPASASQQGESPTNALPRRRRLRDLLLGGTAVLVGIAITIALVKSAPRPVPQPARERSWAVDAIKAEWQSAQPALRVFGEVVAGNELEVRPLVSGRVISIGDNFQNGAVVSEGDELFSIDPFDYEAEVAAKKAALAEAEAKLVENRASLASESELVKATRNSLALRQRDLNRKQDLRNRGSGSQKSADDAALAVSEARQALTSREQTVASLKAQAIQLEAAVEQARVALRRAEKELQDTTVTAPFSGFLTETEVAAGKQVSTSDQIARLIDASRLEVRFQLSNGDFARLIEGGEEDGQMIPGGIGSDNAALDFDGDRGLIGRPLAVFWTVGGFRYRYSGIVERVGAEIDSGSGGVDLYGRLTESRNGVPLRPGAFVQVEMPDRRYENVLTLPENAVSGEMEVFVIEPEKQATTSTAPDPSNPAPDEERSDIPVQEASENQPPESPESDSGDAQTAEAGATQKSGVLLTGRIRPVPVTLLRKVEGQMIVRGENIPEGALITANRFPEIGPAVLVDVRRLIGE